MRRTTMLVSVLGATAMLVSTATFAAGGSNSSFENGQKIFTNGKGSVPACTSCHGEKGMGNDMMGTPRLAGQTMQFIRKQLEDFASDRRTDTTMFVMNANAKGLTKQDRIDVALYLSKQKDDQAELLRAADPSNLDDLKANGVEVGVTHLGKAMVNYGVPEKGIPACKSCHGYNGRGVDPVYPRIGGQKYVYLVNQLKKWRDGTRANDPLSQMQKVARKMSDADIHNAASFLSGAGITTVGNTRGPEQHAPLLYEISTGE